MDDYGETLTFAGVSATPNIATRLFDLLSDGYHWVVASVAIGGFEGWFAAVDPFDLIEAAPSDRDLR